MVGSGVDPVAHYAKVGWRSGLDPHPLFDTDWYLRTNADSMQPGISPAEHFFTSGWREGCDPHPLFDVDFYLADSHDVAAEGTNALLHYLGAGWRQNRDPHPIFETATYRSAILVEEAGFCPLVHYVMFGWESGYALGDLFDADWYKAGYPEALRSGLPAYRYYLEVGVLRGDRPSPWAARLDPPDEEVGDVEAGSSS